MEIMPSSTYMCNTPSKSPQDPSDRKNGFNKKPCKITNGKVGCDCDVSIEKLCPPESLAELIEKLEKDVKNLEVISTFVQIHKDELIKWEKSIYYLLLCDFDDTIHTGEEYMQEAWEEVYLPKVTRMQVLGTLEHFTGLPSMQWVILVAEDGCVYAYKEEKLLLIAKSLREFVENGKRKPYETYNYPEFSEEEDESLEEDEEILKTRQETKDFVDRSADELEDFLLFVS